MCYNKIMVIERVRETIKKHNLIEKGEHIVIGLSGGPDSVCLFSVLTELADEMDLTVHPVHVNHKFRPGAAERDQKYAENLCKSRGIECRSFEVDCIKRRSATPRSLFPGLGSWYRGQTGPHRYPGPG